MKSSGDPQRDVQDWVQQRQGHPKVVKVVEKQGTPKLVKPPKPESGNHHKG
ncbi:MAG: hypothetical protein AB7H96_11965 [Vicinamibacterales bacterium]